MCRFISLLCHTHTQENIYQLLAVIAEFINFSGCDHVYTTRSLSVKEQTQLAQIRAQREKERMARVIVNKYSHPNLVEEHEEEHEIELWKQIEQQQKQSNKGALPTLSTPSRLPVIQEHKHEELSPSDPRRMPDTVAQSPPLSRNMNSSRSNSEKKYMLLKKHSSRRVCMYMCVYGCDMTRHKGVRVQNVRMYIMTKITWTNIKSKVAYHAYAYGCMVTSHRLHSRRLHCKVFLGLM